MNLTKHGPIGGQGGVEIEEYAIPNGFKIKEIHLLTTDVVEGIQFTITDGKGGKTMPLLGGNSSNRKRHFVFSLGRDEYLTGISGHYGWYVDAVRLHTNRRVSPIYGGHGGEKDFYFSANEDEEVIGLVGRADWYVDALGILTKTKEVVLPSDAKGLQLVDGIGPKIAEILIQNKIANLERLAQTAVSDLQAILANAGDRYRLADPTSWPEQAGGIGN
ncbi:MAG: jacalin-like lectin [Chloroflexota bacterium]